MEPKILIENRQARFNYHIEEDFMAGLVLEGWEVKSIMAGRATFNGGASFIRIIEGEAWLDAMTITPNSTMTHGLLAIPQPLRLRKLLLKRSELNKLQRLVTQKGYTLVPLALVRGRKLKLKIGLAKGKKLHDKRETLKARDNARSEAREARGC